MSDDIQIWLFGELAPPDIDPPDGLSSYDWKFSKGQAAQFFVMYELQIQFPQARFTIAEEGGRSDIFMSIPEDGRVLRISVRSRTTDSFSQMERRYNRVQFSMLSSLNAEMAGHISSYNDIFACVILDSGNLFGALSLYFSTKNLPKDKKTLFLHIGDFRNDIQKAILLDKALEKAK